MPIRPSKNVVGKYLEFDPDLAAAVDGFARGRGQTFRAVVMDACRRHLKHPPPPPVAPPDPADVPFPDAAPAPAARTPAKKQPADVPVPAVPPTTPTPPAHKPVAEMTDKELEFEDWNHAGLGDPAVRKRIEEVRSELARRGREKARLQREKRKREKEKGGAR